MDLSDEKASAELIVTTIKKQLVAFVRMPLVAQEMILQRIDPANWTGEGAPPLSLAQWKREMRRVEKARRREISDVNIKRRPCLCRKCKKRGNARFPRYYVANGISYECWLERQKVDRDIEELLEPLRYSREKAGSAVVRTIRKTHRE